MDYMKKKTDKRLKALERDIKKNFNEAYKKCEADLKKIQTKLDVTDDVIKRRNLVMQSKRIQGLMDNMVIDIHNASKIAAATINNETVSMVKDNYLYTLYDLERQAGVSMNFSVYNSRTLAEIIKKDSSVFTKLSLDGVKDKGIIYRRLQGQLTQGLLLGESIRDLSNRIQGVVNRSENDCIRIARTETTRAENQGRIIGINEGAAMGLDVKKQWISTVDARIRDTHKSCHLEIVGKDDTFSNGLEFPGDPRGGASEVCNCRCSVVGVLGEYSDEERKLNEALKKQSFEEWSNG